MNKKSPLKANPLRNPGQSLDEEIQRRLDDQALPWVVAIVSAVILAALEWYRWYFNTPFKPWIYTIIAMMVLIVGLLKLFKLKAEIQRLKLGRDGEKAVGQYLEVLRQSGYKIFHDLQGEGFNVDHVIIGPTGVYSIETKTFSKAIGKGEKIFFDGSTITKNGMQIDRDPVRQAKAQSAWVAELLEASTGRNVVVKPVILFPGWFVESSGKSNV